MKLFAIVTALLALSACAEFPAGTKVAPGFPEDNFELSHNTKVPVHLGLMSAMGPKATKRLVSRMDRRADIL